MVIVREGENVGVFNLRLYDKPMKVSKTSIEYAKMTIVGESETTYESLTPKDYDEPISRFLPRDPEWYMLTGEKDPIHYALVRMAKLIEDEPLSKKEEYREGFELYRRQISTKAIWMPGNGYFPNEVKDEKMTKK